MNIDPRAGKPAQTDVITDIPKLITAYYTNKPDPSVKSQKISFGTSGHRGSSFDYSFNENHILAIAQAICLFRKAHKINGPLYLGYDTHALSAPAFDTTLEVMAANEVEIIISNNHEYTPTPVISFSILNYNRDRTTGLADGIVITPSHNPPDNGGFKYNPTGGGPASTEITNWIEKKANEILVNKLIDVKRIPLDQALTAITTHRFDYLHNYVKALNEVIDMKLISESKISLGVDPLGGAGVHYWEPIAEFYKLKMTVVNKTVDPTFSFMTVDWDGKIRMDPSSPYAMQSLIAMKDCFDISFACDTDHDRHGIVTKSKGLMNPNHYLSVAVSYLLQNREHWKQHSAVGKTVVTTRMIEFVANKAGRKIFDVPVGFKWFADGLLDESLCFGGEESAGASFSKINGKVWTTDKDGFIPALLSAEITAKTGCDPGTLYEKLTKEFGEPFFDRIEARVDSDQKDKLKKLYAKQIHHNELAGENITSIQTNASGNNESIGGIKVTTDNSWFAARPSGTEDIYKIYAESFIGRDHLNNIIKEAQMIVDAALQK